MHRLAKFSEIEGDQAGCFCTNFTTLIMEKGDIVNFQDLEIESIHNVGELDSEKYGSRAQQLRRLFNIGLPVPNGYSIPVFATHQWTETSDHKISRKCQQ